ncbi:hypothetical protein ACHHYP_06913 [Achlya hypogyna]|uniref:Uncharacterized protein n=1 Tax=Achlya hypogyna TaxID=1202772 RepID=A0A1V9ZNI0_ACHHY|nr:hypothetical protein ACHHYP_06913 [Achlya hypogyna]
MEALFETALADVPAHHVLAVLFVSLVAVSALLSWIVLAPDAKSPPPAVKEPPPSATADEIDALLHRRSLREIDREIDAAMHANGRRSPPVISYASVDKATCVRRTMRSSDDASLAARPSDCATEIKVIVVAGESMLSRAEVLHKGGSPESLRRPLRTIEQLLRHYKSPATRDVSKASILCKSLLKHDALGLLRDLSQSTTDPEIESLARAIVESAVASIWN